MRIIQYVGVLQWIAVSTIRTSAAATISTRCTCAAAASARAASSSVWASAAAERSWLACELPSRAASSASSCCFSSSSLHSLWRGDEEHHSVL